MRFFIVLIITWLNHDLLMALDTSELSVGSLVSVRHDPNSFNYPEDFLKDKMIIERRVADEPLTTGKIIKIISGVALLISTTKKTAGNLETSPDPEAEVIAGQNIYLVSFDERDEEAKFYARKEVALLPPK